MKDSKKVEQIIFSEGTEAIRGRCYFCNKDISGEFYCFGCKEFVCEDCDERSPDAIGLHDISEHSGREN